MQTKRPEIMSVSPRTRTCRGLAMALLLFAGIPDAVSAQRTREATDAALRGNCRLAAHTLENGHPAPKSDWALQLIPRCTESGGPALKAVWRTPPTDSVSLEQLVEASARLLDERVFDAVLSTARDISAARVARLAALRVLAAYIDPSAVVSPDVFAKLAANAAIIPLFAHTSHGIHQTTGSVPLPPGARDATRVAFELLSRTDSDPVIRRAGKVLLANLF